MILLCNTVHFSYSKEREPTKPITYLLSCIAFFSFVLSTSILASLAPDRTDPSVVDLETSAGCDFWLGLALWRPAVLKGWWVSADDTGLGKTISA